MNQNEVIQSLIGNAIITTAYLANEFCIQTKGEFIVPEADYLNLVKQFQYNLSKRIIPVKTGEDLKDEAKKFVKSLLDGLKENEDGTASNGSSEDKVDS